MAKPSTSEIYAIAAEARADHKTVKKFFDAEQRERMKPAVRERVAEAVERRRNGDRA